MRLGHGSHKRSPWWHWPVMILAAATVLPGTALVVAADEPLIIIEAKWIVGPADKLESLRIGPPVTLGEVPGGDSPDSEDSMDEMPDWPVRDDLTGRAVGRGRATTVREKNLPVTFAVLDDEQAAALERRLLTTDDAPPEAIGSLGKRMRALLGFKDTPTAAGRVSVLAAPKVVVPHGQTATVRIGSQSPFVVSVKRVVGETGEAKQPVIRVIDEGLRMQLRPRLLGKGSVRLDCQLALSRIVGVETFTFADGGKSDTTVQIPEVETIRVDIAARLPDGKTLLVGGLKTRDDRGNPQSMLVMLRPTEVGPGPPRPDRHAFRTRSDQAVDLARPVDAGDVRPLPRPAATRELADTEAKTETRLILGGVTPRIIIQEEEEERLGILPP